MDMEPTVTQPLVIQEPGIRPGTSIYHSGDGYYYRFNNETFRSITFKCVHYTCNGRAVLHLGQAFQQTQPHNHPRNNLLSEIRDARRRIVERARSVRYVSFAGIVEEERGRIRNHGVRAHLTYRRLRSAMQRTRALVFPTLPANLVNLIFILEDPLWQSLITTNDFQDSIYSGSVQAEDGSYHIIFISKRGLQMLREVMIIFVDGTFKITPAIGGCYQVFTIVTISSHTTIPLVWCLMENKSEVAYIAVFLHLRARLRDWAFSIVISDYEDAIIKAFYSVFGIVPQGCYFHCVNAIASWAESNLSRIVLQTYPAVKDIVRCCCALPLLPPQLLQRGLNVIGIQALNLGLFLYQLVRPFLMYVQEEWLDHVNRGRTMSVFGSDHRTNNASESNNRRMGRRIGVTHPNVFMFIRSIADFEETAMLDLESLALGIIPSRHRRSSAVNSDARIKELTRILLQSPIPSDGSIVQFLHDAAFAVDNVMNTVMGIASN